MAAIGYSLTVNETLASSATDDTAFANVANATISGSSLDANSDYLIFVSAVVGGNSTSLQFEFRINEAVGGALSYSTHTQEPRFSGSPTGQPYFFMEKITTDASPTGNDYTLQFRCISTGVARVQARMMMAIKLDDLSASDWAYSSDTTDRNAVSSSAWVDTSASVTIGDGTSDYLIFASSYWDTIAADDDARTVIDVGGTEYGEILQEGENAAENFSCGTIAYVAAPSASSTAKVKIRSASDSLDVSNAKIFALRLNAFEDYGGVRDVTAHTDMTQSAWNTTSTLSITTNTAASRTWFFIGNSIYNPSAPGNYCYRKLTDSGLGDIIGDTTQAVGFNGPVATVMLTPAIIFNDTSSTVANSTSISMNSQVYPIIAGTDDCNEAYVVGFTFELATVTNETVYPFTGPWR
jgi:hypothetical protein